MWKRVHWLCCLAFAVSQCKSVENKGYESGYKGNSGELAACIESTKIDNEKLDDCSAIVLNLDDDCTPFENEYLSCVSAHLEDANALDCLNAAGYAVGKENQDNFELSCFLGYFEKFDQVQCMDFANSAQQAGEWYAEVCIHHFTNQINFSFLECVAYVDTMAMDNAESKDEYIRECLEERNPDYDQTACAEGVDLVTSLEAKDSIREHCGLTIQ